MLPRWRGAPKAFPTSHSAGCPTYPSLTLPGAMDDTGLRGTSDEQAWSRMIPRIMPRASQSRSKSHSPFDRASSKPHDARSRAKRGHEGPCRSAHPASTLSQGRPAWHLATPRPTSRERDGGNQLLSTLAPCGSISNLIGMRPPVTLHVVVWPKLQMLWVWSVLAVL
jgi:hypothetical protein